MSNIIKEKAKEYLHKGLSVIPTKEDKTPALLAWKSYQINRLPLESVDSNFSGNDVKGLAIICGNISGGLEVIDVDTKYDITGSLWEDLSSLIEQSLPDVYSRLVIAQTKSGGYHIYYRCSSIEGNLKLANRETTSQEKEERYKKEIAKGATEEEAKRRSTNDKIRVLIETRGEGGYVVAPPTNGYTYLKGEPTNITTITPEERSLLLSISKSFNEVEEDKPKVVSTPSATPSNSVYLSPFEDYNNRGEVIEFLENKGWTVVSEIGDRINVLRPGETDTKSSGNYLKSKRVLRIFSSSTEFSTDRAYSASQVFTLLECNNDTKLAYRKLLELGYGEPYPVDNRATEEVSTANIKVEVVNSVNRESSVIFNPGERLNISKIKTALGEEIIISTTTGAQEEILKAISFLKTTGKRIYIKEGGNKEIRDYRYQLSVIFKKYGEIEQQSGELTDRDKDNLLEEIVLTASTLQPIDKDLFLKEFIDLEPVKELGISEDSLAITIDRLTSKRDKETQETEFKKLMTDVAEIQKEIGTPEALELLEEKIKEVKAKDRATEFSNLLKPIKETELKERLSDKPDSLDSGYTIEGEPLLLPSGAISILAAPTSHGKTTFLINLALNVTANKGYIDKEFYFFSYEEDGDSILLNTLNTYLDNDLSSNNRKTLKSYFTTGSPDFIRTENRDYFNATKERFFRELIDNRRLNISYTNYDSDTLIQAIRYLHKNAKPGAIFIDYMQLLHKGQGGKNKYYSRQEELKQICLDLKDVAVETGLPIILGAQFNREVVSQLRLHATKIGEAGDIERIANLIVGFWNNNFKPLATEGELAEINRKGVEPNTIYTTILKNRGGRVGMEEVLSFTGNTGKIGNRSSSVFNPLK